MCGEYGWTGKTRYCGLGSPPHAWGTLILIILALTGIRITPTCVGNTGVSMTAELFSGDHPHMRGEYLGANQNPSKAKAAIKQALTCASSHSGE